MTIRAFSMSMILGLLTAAAAAQAPAPATLSPEQVSKFAESYENAVNRRHASAINGHFDIAAMLERTYEGLELPEDVRGPFSAGVEEGFDWGVSLAQALGDEGHYKLLGVRSEDGQPRALFRLVNADGGLNYHDTFIGARADGTPAIMDAYVFMSGETLSHTIRRSLQEALTGGGPSHIITIGRAIDAMATRMQAGAFEEALQVYAGLPPAVREDKTVMIVRVTCAGQVGAEATTQACADFRRLFPNDPCIDLVTFDQLIFQSRWDDALASLARIRDAVGEDAYLDDLAASVHVQAGRLAQAKTIAEGAVVSEPTLEEPYWTMLSIALLEQDHDATARWLSTLERKFSYVFPDLASVPEYADFAKSEPYRKWRATQVAGAE